MIDVCAILDEASVEWTRTGKHSTEGWISVCCPHCLPSDTSFHMGINETNGATNCWRCGPHRFYDTLVALGVSRAGQAIKDHSDFRQREKVEKVRLPSVSLPSTAGPIVGPYAAYLKGRGFDPVELETVWGCRASGPIGKLAYRVLIPYTVRGTLVTFQGRAISDKQELRYDGLKDSESVLTTKECVFGMDQAPGSSVVVVEGPLDCIRCGPGAVALSGTAYSDTQIGMLRSRFKSVTVLFDNESKAQLQGRKLAVALGSLGMKARNANLEDVKDPGELPINEARTLCQELNR